MLFFEFLKKCGKIKIRVGMLVCPIHTYVPSIVVPCDEMNSKDCGIILNTIESC